MTKAERLFFMADFLRARQPVTLDDIVSECQVSERTVYRDLCSLSNLGVCVRYDEGYRVDSKSRPSGPDLDAERIELLRFALRTTPLSNIPAFRAAMKAVDATLQASAKRTVGAQAHRPILQVDRPKSMRATMSVRLERAKLGALWSAATSKRKLWISMASETGLNCVLVRPLDLTWSGSDWSLRYTTSDGRPSQRALISQIELIRTAKNSSSPK